MKKAFVVLSLVGLLVVVYMAGRHSVSKPPASTQAARRVLYYVDPMHPSYRADKPGIAPDCGMQLEPVYEGDANASEATAGSSVGLVKVSLEQQQLIGLKTVEASRSADALALSVPGRVLADETRSYRVTVGIDGVVRTTFDQSVGSLVKKDEVLAVFDSPDLLSVEQTFLTNWSRAPEGKYETTNTSEWKDQTLKFAASRLRSVGMSEKQLNDLAKTRKFADSIEIASPVDGVITARSISAGQRAEKGAEFYRIADLSRVWIAASVAPEDADALRPGTVADISLPSQKRTWKARVSEVVPQFDPATRTVQVRLETENAGFVLRPDMFVNVNLRVPLPNVLTVPSEALLDTGMARIVYVDRGNGAFEQRRVKTGRRTSERIEIMDGLAEGERIVASGTFLLDSESRLRTPQRDSVLNQLASLPKAAKDPSCGMNVSPADSVASGLTESYQGTTYYFCSKSCLKKFHNNPATLVSQVNSGGKAPAGVRGSSRD